MIRDGVDNTDKFRHDIFAVTLPSGLAYSLDLTGSQYGWYEPTAPWDIWRKERCLKLLKTRKFGSSYLEEAKTLKAAEMRANGLSVTIKATPAQKKEDERNSFEIYAFKASEEIATKLLRFCDKKGLEPKNFLHLKESKFKRASETIQAEMKTIAKTAAGDWV